jgi:hypothetical protein
MTTLPKAGGNSEPTSTNETPEVLSPAEAAARRLEVCKSEWQAAAGKARKKLWALLAAIFVAHEIFNLKPDAREQMVKKVKNMLGYSKGHLDPRTQSLLDLLVTYSVGPERETASSRCQYAAAIRAALEDPNLKRTEQAFLDWLKRKGGIVKAGMSNRQKDELVVRFKYAEFKHHIASMARRGTIEFQVNPESEVHDGFTVIFASYHPEDPEPLQVIDALGAEGVIQHVSHAVAINRAKKLSEAERQTLLNEQNLWDLNRVALKLARKLSGHVTWDDADRWARALIALDGEDDKNGRKWFTGFSRETFEDPSGTDKLSLVVENPDYDELDPGRYIKTARQGALMPYNPADANAVDKYIQKHTDPYIYAKPIELPASEIAGVPERDEHCPIQTPDEEREA